ncbi:hypothetical protein, partial [Salmonella enterica]|uniref:hypothetical protein n=1 Tax=Salmonella enterica TaxID=28901 RepID=UPI003FA7B846
TADNNSQKDLIGRVAVTVPADYNSWLRELKFGASIYKGHTNLTDTALGAVAGQGKSDRYGFDVNYTRLPWSVAYERVEGRDDAWTTTTQAAPYTGTGLQRTR